MPGQRAFTLCLPLHSGPGPPAPGLSGGQCSPAPQGAGGAGVEAASAGASSWRAVCRCCRPGPGEGVPGLRGGARTRSVQEEIVPAVQRRAHGLAGRASPSRVDCLGQELPALVPGRMLPSTAMEMVQPQPAPPSPLPSGTPSGDLLPGPLWLEVSSAGGGLRVEAPATCQAPGVSV